MAKKKKLTKKDRTIAYLEERVDNLSDKFYYVSRKNDELEEEVKALKELLFIYLSKQVLGGD